MDRQTRRRLERAFYDYDRLKDKAAHEIADLAEADMAMRYDTVRVAGGIGGSKTENAAMRISDAVKWCWVVENTLTRFRFGVEHDVIIFRYFHCKTDLQTYTLFNISERAFYYMVDRVMYEAEQWAIEFGLLPDPHAKPPEKAKTL